MKALAALIWVLPLLAFVHQPLAADDDMAMPTSTETAVYVGDTKIVAEFPKNIASVIRTPDTKPTFIQGTAGSEGISIGRSDDFDIYSVQVFDEQALARRGHDKAESDIDSFIQAEMQHFQGKFNVKDRDKAVPASLKALDSKTDRYVSFSGSYKKKKDARPKLFLWRVMTVDGKFVVASREIGGKTKVDPTKEQEWAFLQSVQVKD